MSRECGKQNQFKTVCKSVQYQQQDQHGCKLIQDIGQEVDLHAEEPSKQEGNFGVLRVKYINHDSVKSIIFTKLESSTSQKLTLMPLKIFKTLFPKLTTEE